MGDVLDEPTKALIFYPCNFKLTVSIIFIKSLTCYFLCPSIEIKWCSMVTLQLILILKTFPTLRNIFCINVNWKTFFYILSNPICTFIRMNTTLETILLWYKMKMVLLELQKNPIEKEKSKLPISYLKQTQPIYVPCCIHLQMNFHHMDH